MITVSTTKGTAEGTLQDVTAWLAEHQPGGVTLHLGDELHHVDLPDGDEVADWAEALAFALVGQEVQAGTIPADYDHGTVVDARPGEVRVAWEAGGETTWTGIAGLAPYSELDRDRHSDAWRVARASL